MALLVVSPVPACCPAPPSGKPVVNADQTVVILWDAATKTQHFIRQASFKSEADDFGFLVPTPTQPELERVRQRGLSVSAEADRAGEEEGRTAERRHGLRLRRRAKPPAEAGELSRRCECWRKSWWPASRPPCWKPISADALVGWLKDNGYAFSPEVEAWAKPYVEAGWKITALKVAKAEGRQDRQERGRLGVAHDVQDRPAAVPLPRAGPRRARPRRWARSTGCCASISSPRPATRAS